MQEAFLLFPSEFAQLALHPRRKSKVMVRRGSIRFRFASSLLHTSENIYFSNDWTQ